MSHYIQSRKRRHAGHRERGAVSIIVALSLVVLIGFIGLALDLGKLYVTRSELQNGADACALAAARDLTGASPLSVSEAAGISAASANSALFQSTSIAMTVDSNVTYSDSLDDTFESKDSITYALANIHYVQCTTRQSDIANWFIQALNVIPGINIANAAVSASAVATTGAAQTTCAIPVFVCTPPTASPPSTSYAIGQWLGSKISSTSGGTYGGGNFGWANLSGGTGASQLKGQLTGAGQCSLTPNQPIGNPGNIASIDTAWNSRFGIYKNGNGNSAGVTDFTGYAYTPTTWTGMVNGQIGGAFNDFIQQRKSATPYQGDSAAGLSTNGSAASKATYQAGADRRLALVPMVDCSTLLTGGTHTTTAKSFGCVLMLDPMQTGGNIDSVTLEYLGASDLPGSPCATQGIPGAGTGVGPKVPVLVR
ncbi:pilus assembly protein TadG-related protein [Paraburkholderia madseniana]|uniref:TadE/TadG family type IV pilus assembly protein n=1 Tax=Paraburkholderia madseniana TaxID=2599607 RepID=UPI0038B8C186